MWRIANWLRRLGSRLVKALNINVESSPPAQLEDLSEEDLQAYLQVLEEILRAISESNGEYNS
ncbi:hypothetical protein IQ247_01755 [Plectonema cf. radiosum LEGE 06105]|uniref:Uncharacterized protein n=1 Tax=Plectonema cf. radiosum LEGE 06105 TaxID=945769 RepID=A0A8J7K157_9CYAN|nr:hypothetical protein [Plectonema radiosum]MBE9211452.1 hypothetical protein [Plectonema cf. radiosum LEGE 06105]